MNTAARRRPRAWRGAGRILLATLPAVLASCTAVDDPVRPSAASPAATAAPVPPATPAATPAVPAPPAASTVLTAPRFSRSERSGVTFEGVGFDSRNHRLAVVDQPGGPGSRFADSAAAGSHAGALAATNAGFFTPDGAPLGLVIAAGKRAGAWNTASSLGSGIWCDQGGSPRITRREALGPAAASSMRELIQAGPMLIDHGRAVGGLNAEKSSIRTVVLWDGGSRWWIGRTSFCTLSRLAEVLSQSPPAGWPVAHALNLDGGRSTDLWVSSAVDGGPASWRTPFNKPVRNFLVLLPR